MSRLPSSSHYLTSLMKPNSFFSNKFIGVFKWIWIIAVAFFVVTFVVKKMEQISSIIGTMELSTVLISGIFLLGAKLFLSVNLLYSLKFINIPISIIESLKIYNYTQLAKYIPGKIWHFVGKAGFYTKRGMSLQEIQHAIVLETLWIISMAVVIGVGFLLLSNLSVLMRLLRDSLLYFLIAFLFSFFLVMIVGFTYKGRLIEFLRYLKNWHLDIAAFFLQCVIWVFMGLSFFSLLNLGANHIHFVVYIIGIYALAYAVGSITPFAPGGIGVREAILVVGLDTLFSQDALIMFTGLHRILYIVIELFLVLISFSLPACIKNRED